MTSVRRFWFGWPGWVVIGFFVAIPLGLAALTPTWTPWPLRLVIVLPPAATAVVVALDLLVWSPARLRRTIEAAASDGAMSEGGCAGERGRQGGRVFRRVHRRQAGSNG